MVLSPPPPPGEVLIWDFFRGKVYLHGVRLPYGIISGGGGGICHGIGYLIMKFAWGEIYHRGGSFTIRYCFPPVGFLRGGGGAVADPGFEVRGGPLFYELEFHTPPPLERFS